MSARAPLRTAREHTTRTTTHDQGLHVLLIDDALEHLLPLAEILRRAGFTPTIATSADEALFEIEATPPDVVVVDPAMVRPADAQIMALLATANVACIIKPGSTAELLALLDRTACAGSRTRTHA